MVRRRQGGASATARASFSVGLHRWRGHRVRVVLPITSIISTLPITSTLPIRSTLPITSSLPSLERCSFLFGGGGNQGTVQLMDLDIDQIDRRGKKSRQTFGFKRGVAFLEIPHM